ncbi:unnamed protein product [Nesidiocoris tenuis]|uniref:Uncharacterized protein n=1 Tax=Nesidiocoris tenuis TaxID=355587 RepID=A0A6H5GFF4_9HEMI|nr:unnamed protein product [Nesidiocoris tenuis]
MVQCRFGGLLVCLDHYSSVLPKVQRFENSSTGLTLKYCPQQGRGCRATTRDGTSALVDLRQQRSITCSYASISYPEQPCIVSSLILSLRLSSSFSLSSSVSFSLRLGMHRFYTLFYASFITGELSPTTGNGGHQLVIDDAPEGLAAGRRRLGRGGSGRRRAASPAQSSADSQVRATSRQCSRQRLAIFSTCNAPRWTARDSVARNY